MHENCSIYKTTDFIGKKWTLLIILELHKNNNNPKRFNELKKSIPKITQKMLSSRLKELEKEEIATKKIDKTSVPFKSEYKLTKSGLDFIKIIQDMKKWSLKWKYKNKECENTNCLNCTL